MKIYTRFTLLFIVCLALCGLGSPGAFGQPPSLINFRGQLLDNGGQPVTASVAVQLRIFSAATGGTELYLVEEKAFLLSYQLFTGLEIRPTESACLGLRYRWLNIEAMESFSSRNLHLLEMYLGYLF